MNKLSQISRVYHITYLKSIAADNAQTESSEGIEAAAGSGESVAA